MHVCSYLDMDGWMDGCSYVCMHAGMHVCDHVCMHTYVGVYIPAQYVCDFSIVGYECVHACMDLRMCVCVCMYECMCIAI